MPVLKKVEVRWANVLTPNTTFEPHVYQVDAILSKEQAMELRKLNYPVKRNDDDEYFIKIKRGVHRKDGSLNTKPKLIDGNKKELDVLVGNGSICNIQYSPYEWEFKKRTGISLDLVGVQVLELIPYEGKAPVEDEFEEEGDTKVAEGEANDNNNEGDFDDDDLF